MPQDEMIQALMGQQMAGGAMGQQQNMLNTPPPYLGMLNSQQSGLGPLGGVSGEGGSAEPGGFMDTLMHEYMNERMKADAIAKQKYPRYQSLMDQQQQQGQSIMNAVPRPNPMPPMGPR